MVQDFIIEHESENLDIRLVRQSGYKKILPFNVKNYKKYKGGIRVYYEIIIDLGYGYERKTKYTNNVLFSYDEYKSYMRDTKLRKIGTTLGDKVRERLDQYLEFDSDELFPIGGLVRVFGGAVRDSIAEKEIHDVDILCGSLAHHYVENILEKNGYSFVESLTPKDLSSIYNDIKIINEPHCWVKGDSIVQLIRPATSMMKKNDSYYEQSFKELIRNVDISCCGVSYDGEKVYENYLNAVSHCRSGIYIVNENAKMYSKKRIQFRRIKLNDRGWVEIEDNTQENRDVKIDKILNSYNLDFVPEYKKNLYYSTDNKYENGGFLPGSFDDLWD